MATNKPVKANQSMSIETLNAPKPSQNWPVICAALILVAVVIAAANLAGQKQALAVLIGGLAGFAL